MMNKILLAFLAVAPAWAACVPANGPCEVTVPGTQQTASISSSALGNSTLRGEWRIVGFNWAALSGYGNTYAFGGFGFQTHGTSGTVALYLSCGSDSVSTGCGNYGLNLNYAGSVNNDITIRVQREITGSCAAGSQFTMEVYDTQTGTNLNTGVSNIAPITACSSNSQIVSNGVVYGGTGNSGYMSFMRVFPTQVSIGTFIPVGIASPATLGDWEFVNNGTDTSGLSGQNFPTGTYGNAPVYNPSCNAGAQANSVAGSSVGVGSGFTLNGSNSYPLDGGASLAYAWTVLAGSPNSVTITSPSSVTSATSATGAFGGYNFQLVVTDGHSNSSTCTVHNGAVITSLFGIINLTAEGLDATSQKFIGPLIAYGQNPWPYADTSQLLTLTQQINNLATYYTPYWRTSLGTATITAGSSTFSVGSGGLAPCGGTTSPSLNTAAFIWQYTGTDSLTHYTYFPVTACTTSTVTVSFNNNPNYPASPNTPWPTCSSACSGGWNWGYSDSSTPGTYSPQYQWGIWRSPSLAAPGNYYDNAKSFYAMYWRTGIDTYLTAFQTMADTWWENPWMDQGFNCYAGVGTGFAQNGNPCPAPQAFRSMSLTGVVLRALQQGAGSSKWAGLRVVWNLIQYYIGTADPNSGYQGIDGREDGYQMGGLAMCALADPDGTQQSTCRATIKASLGLKTTSASGISSGSQTVTPASMAGITSGLSLLIDAYTANQEFVTVTGTTGSTFTATFANSHSGGFAIYAGIWTPYKRSDIGGSWGNFYNNSYFAAATSITALGGGGSVCVTNGSTAITGTGTSWTAAMQSGAGNGGPIWFFNSSPNAIPPSNASGDPVYYSWTVTDGTHATLGSVYAGTTGCTGTSGTNKGFVVGYPQNGDGFVGWGTQPTYTGHLGQAFYLASLAMAGYDSPSQTTFLSYMDAAVQLAIASGNPGLGGLYNGVYMVGCTPPIASSNVPCYPQGSTASAQRSLALELPRAFVNDYQTFHSATVRNAMNTYMSQMFCQTTVTSPNGGCVSDGNYLNGFLAGSGLYVTGTPPNGMAPKWAGQLCGYTEACDSWAVIALSGYAGPVTGANVSGAGVMEEARALPDRGSQPNQETPSPRESRKP